MFSLFKKLFLIIFLCSPLVINAESQLAGNSLESVNVEITTHLGDAQNFIEGDQISFILSLDKAAYIYLFYQDAEGHVLQLIPNPNQPSNFYQPGLFIPVPDQTSNFKFTVQPPFGEDRVWVFAIDKPVSELPGEKFVNGLKLMDLSIPQIRAKIKSQASTQYGEHYLSIFTRAGQ